MTAARFYAAACRAHDAHDRPAAIQLYSSALQLDPKHLESLIGRGVAHKETKQYSAALTDYSRALGMASSDKITLLILSNRANVHSAQGSFALALADHNTALGLNQQDPVLWANRGSTLFKLGRLGEAKSDCLKSLSLCGEANAVALYNLGLIHARSGEVRAAIESFKRAAGLFEQQLHQNPTNRFHAEDCWRQIAQYSQSEGRRESSSQRGARPSPTINVNSDQPLPSPSHKHPHHSQQPSRTQIGTSTPSSRQPARPGHTHPLTSSSSAFGSSGGGDGSYTLEDFGGSSGPPVVTTAFLAAASSTSGASSATRVGDESRGSLSVSRNTSSRETNDRPLARGGATPPSAAVGSAPAPPPPVYALARPAALSYTQLHPSPASSPTHNHLTPSHHSQHAGHAGHGGGYSQPSPISPHSSTTSSMVSPDSVEPLLSPPSASSSAGKKRIQIVKPTAGGPRATKPAPKQNSASRHTVERAIEL